MKKNENIPYLTGLNGIRAIASVSILFIHLNGYIGTIKFDFLNHWNYGVTFFFALSGFLITYLLLFEKKRHEAISYKVFYRNRILRIFPLYFFYLFGSIIYMFIDDNCLHLSFNKFLFYFSFLANIPFLMNIAPLLLAHYWSLGTEEQFYIFWPFITQRSKNILKIIFLLLLSFTILKLIGRFIDSRYNIPCLTGGFQTFAFDNMLIGAIGAYFYIYKNEFIKKYLLSYWIQVIMLVCFILLFLSKFHFASVIDNQLVSLLTVLLIYNTSLNKKTIFRLDNTILNFIGKISFGIYVYHPFIIHIVIPKIIHRHYFSGIGLYTAAIYGSSLLITILVSWISFVSFESYFLRKKSKNR